MSLETRQRLLMLSAAIVIVATLFVSPIPQDPTYHDFADVHPHFGMPNALNILSNILILCVGIAGLLQLSGRRSLQTLPELAPAYVMFFIGLVLTAAGSSWYHLAPDNPALAWDRGAMALGFMAFFTILLGERVSLRAARLMFPILMVLGPASILYWHITESAGQGDLRAYALVQFLPILLMPLILTLFESRHDRGGDLWLVLLVYLLAKLCELFDHELFALTGWIGGHALKHLVAGLACFVFLRHLQLRRVVES